MVEAMVYIARTGIPWRDLPLRFGPWSSVYTRWSRWAKSGLWAAVLDELSKKASGQLRHLDASHSKVHQDASNPAGGQRNQSIGRTKGGLNCKITALVDARGKATQISLAPGNCHDIVAAKEIVFPDDKTIVADKGYDCDALREKIEAKKSRHCIPPRAGRKQPATYHKGYYKRRHQVENFFQRIKRYRRIGTRYEKLDITFLAFLNLVAILDWLK